MSLDANVTRLPRCASQSSGEMIMKARPSFISTDSERRAVAPGLVGILGGMGPLATVDFMEKIIRATPAKRDQDHIPLIVHAVPQIPDRTRALIEGGDDPFPALLAGLAMLERCGARLIAIPCNAAHAWFERLVASTDVPLLHIAEAVRQRIAASADPMKRIALMAARGTVEVGIYQGYLKDRLALPDDEIQERISSAIAFVKAGDLEAGRVHAESAGRALLSTGVDAILLGCTELPIALAKSEIADHCVDATHCLAEACVAFSLRDVGESDHAVFQRKTPGPVQ
jgi:aspartate racemase